MVGAMGFHRIIWTSEINHLLVILLSYYFFESLDTEVAFQLMASVLRYLLSCLRYTGVFP